MSLFESALALLAVAVTDSAFDIPRRELLRNRVPLLSLRFVNAM
jgi:hypothetical protein